MIQKTKPASDAVRVRRGYKQARYDRATIDRILDAGHVAHFGFIAGDEPVVIPMLYWRDGSFVYWHGSSASRAMASSANQRICMTVTLLDGLVFAKSAFHHSANYQSAAIFAVPEIVGGDDAKLRALETMMDQIAPDRWSSLRPVNDQELKATHILSLPINEFSTKIRTGGPVDAPGDEIHPVWAGHVPIETRFTDPIPARHNSDSLPVPKSLANFGAGRNE